MLVSKFCGRQPLYHPQQVFARAGVELPVSTLAGWVGTASVWLMPLAAAPQGARSMNGPSNPQPTHLQREV